MKILYLQRRYLHDISVSKYRKIFDGVTILQDASFHIEEREKAALVGINGAGKSTLFRIIVGELS